MSLCACLGIIVFEQIFNETKKRRLEFYLFCYNSMTLDIFTLYIFVWSLTATGNS